MNKILTLQDVERARAFYDNGYWSDQTLYMLLREHARATPDREALCDTNSVLTYRSVLDWVDTLAGDLHRSGLREGDRVSIWLPSRVESVIILLACSRMGYVANTSLHRDYTCAEIVALLERAGSSALFAQPGYGADARQHDINTMLGRLRQLKKVYCVPPLAPEASRDDPPVRFGDLERKAGLSLPYRTSPDRVMYLAFTSGTTGQPKGVMHSDNTLLANARAIVKDWDFGPGLVTYTMSPMSHNIGTVGLAVTLVAGGRFVVHTPHDATRLLDRILETGATFLLGVPTHAIDLVTAARERSLPKLGQVDAFQLGGSPIPPATVRELVALGVRPQNSFGMTENCSFQYTRPDDPPDIVVNTCGRACAGIELKLWSAENQDQEVPVGSIGELGVRGACLMLGYFADQEATERAFNKAGWFMTGDLGLLDDQGNLRVAGRKKDLIIRGGHNIHPARIEDFAMRHDCVIKAAAFGVADQRLGERVCLAVIAKRPIKASELLQHLDKMGLSKSDMPEYYIELDAFPLTASGKVLKRALVDLVAQGEVKPQAVRFSR